MGKLKVLMAILLTLVMLWGCQADPAETTAPETTVPVTTVPETTIPETTVPETTVPETTEAPTQPQTEPPETTVPEGTLRVGYYVLEEAYNNDKPWTDAEIEESTIYVEIREGHTGTMNMNGWMLHLDWTNRFLIIDGMYAAYTLEQGVLTVDYDHQTRLVLKYQGEELPEEYGPSALQAGMYIVFAYQDTYYDEIEFFDSFRVENGGLDLKEDHTGVFWFGEERIELKWDSGSIMLSSMPMEYVMLEPEDGKGQPALALRYMTKILYLERLANPVPYE